MADSIITIFSILSIFLVSVLSCNDDKNLKSNHTDNTKLETRTDTLSNQLMITIGSRTFDATLLDNPTVTEFKSRLPLTITMSELNGNEKLYRFSTDFPVNPSNPGTINTGDLMVYGSNTVVLFYEGLNTSYSYTRMGKIDDPTGLRNALGTGNVTVTFKME